MSDFVPSFVIEFNKIVDECSTFIYVTRDRELQRGACAKLENLLARVETEKESARTSGDEDYANLLLGCECVANALVSEINMWLLLKDGRPDEAWDALLGAQSGLSSAMRAHEGFAQVEGRIRRLDSIERLIFPPQVFLSTGMLVKSQICSVCGGEYEDCEHVKGRPYMGKFCTVRLIPSAIDHVSIVDNPANKRCRILKFSVDGGCRNRMTWAVEPGPNSGQQPPEGLKAEGIVGISSPCEENAEKSISFVD
jgi:hypothetical protein